jgi:hypothetical protein
VASPWPLRPCGIHHAQNAASRFRLIKCVGQWRLGPLWRSSPR